MAKGIKTGGRQAGTKNFSSAQAREMIAGCVDMEKFWQLIGKKAMNGNEFSQKMIAEYYHGKPRQAVELNDVSEGRKEVMRMKLPDGTYFEY